MAKENSNGYKPFSGGLWIIPVLCFIGGCIFFYFAWQAHTSNSTITGPGGVIENTGNVPLTQIGQFWFAVICWVASGIIAWAMYRDK